MPSLPSAAVIGAGSSGIAAVKTLHAAGFDVTGFEASDRVGGNWVYKNPNGMSSAYRSLHINTSRERMAYSDFPMPASYPDFPHHTHIAEYFDAYVDRFGFRERIRFRSRVAAGGARAGGRLGAHPAGGERERFDVLLVANGHHWDPRWPEPAIPGAETFTGEQLHSHAVHRRGPGVLPRQVGRGARAWATRRWTSPSRRASRPASVQLAARRGAHVLPKYLFGKPIDQHVTSARIPWAVRQRLFESMFKVAIGDMQRYGLPEPDHRLGAAHPTISDDILSRIAHGTVTPRPMIAALDGDTVRFADGSEVQADVVVYCTGYRVSFPFFDAGLIAAPENDLPLFRRVFRPGFADLAFVGLLQPLGAVMPLAEAQSAWVRDYLAGRYALPDGAAMAADMAAEREAMFARYVASRRHTMQVDFDDYLAALARERRAGARRAARAGHRLPVLPAGGAVAA